MIQTTDDKREFAKMLRDDGDTDTLEFIRVVAKEWFDGPMPDNVSITHLRKKSDDSQR